MKMEVQNLFLVSFLITVKSIGEVKTVGAIDIEVFFSKYVNVFIIK